MVQVIRYPIEADANSLTTGVAAARAALGGLNKTFDDGKKAVAEWTGAEQRAAMRMAGLHDEALKLDRSMKAAAHTQDEWTSTGQRAAMRMESLHEQALKMNTSFKSASDDTQRTADTLKAFDSALGGPIAGTQQLAPALDIAGLGFKNLNTTAAGFNAQSAGVVGAGLAIGTAIGSWLDTFPAVQKTVDGIRDSLFGLIGVAKQADNMKGIGGFQELMSKSNEQAVARQIEGMKRMGKSVEEIADFYKKGDPPARTAIDRAIEMGEAHKKAAAAAKLHAAETKKVEDAWKAMVKPFKDLTQGSQRADLDVKLMAAFEALGPLAKASVNDVAAVADSLRKMGSEGQQAARDLTDAFKSANGFSILGSGKGNLGGLLKDVPEFTPITKATRTVTLDLQFVEKKTHDWKQELLGVADVFGRIGGRAGGLIADMLSGVVGVSDSMKQWKEAGSGFGGILSKIGAGGGILGIGLSIGKGIAGLFGGGEEKEVNKLRDSQLAALGGWQKLHKELAAAGNEGLMKKIFDAKTIADFNAAMGAAQGLLGMRSQAQNELNAAAEKYGLITQNQIEMQGLQLLKEHDLLETQFKSADVLAKMAPGINEYVQEALKAGQLIPANFKPILEQMASLGLLTDASGQAVDNLADAGVDAFGEFSDATQELVKELRELVNVLKQAQGIGPIDVPDGGGGQARGGGRFDPLERFAAGGLVRKPTRALIGEEGPELVLPLRNPPSWARGLMGGGGGGGGQGGAPTIIVQIGPQAIRDFIVREVRNGTLPLQG